MRWSVLFMWLVFTLGLNGCARHIATPISSKSSTGNVAVEIWASTDLAQPNDKVKFRAIVTNLGPSAHIVELNDKPVLDILIEQGGIITHWSDGKPLSRDVTYLELAPGQSKSIEIDYVATCCDSIGARATFIYNNASANDPVRPSITVNVKYAPGPLGP